MSKPANTFEQCRKTLLKRMSARSPQCVIKKVIPFRNQDVPNYLRKLDEFEQQSRRANLIVGQRQPAIAGGMAA